MELNALFLKVFQTVKSIRVTEHFMRATTDKLQSTLF